MMRDKLRRKIEMEEGYEEKAYLCPAGYWTIGSGINLEAEPIPKDLADEWLDRITERREAILKGFPWFNRLSENRQIVIIDMSFQLGMSGLLQFQNMIQAIMDSDYRRAAEEMLDSRWARQTPNRAHRNADTMRTGDLEE